MLLPRPSHWNMLHERGFNPLKLGSSPEYTQSAMNLRMVKEDSTIAEELLVGDEKQFLKNESQEQKQTDCREEPH